MCKFSRPLVLWHVTHPPRRMLRYNGYIEIGRSGYKKHSEFYAVPKNVTISWTKCLPNQREEKTNKYAT